ncbi:MAG: efflux RND transporter permease subunit [Bacteroidota bacterium]
MNIPELSIKNYQFTILVFVCLFVLGIGTFISMPRSEDPKLDIPIINVIAVYPGASPEDIESQVVDPIEEALNELDDIEELVTVVTDGVAKTELEFTYGFDADDKYEEVQAQLNSIKKDLPPDLFLLEANKVSTSTVAIFQLALVSETASYHELEEEGEKVKDVIEKVSGVKKVELIAFPEREVRIALDPVKMTEMNISLDDIENAVRSNNANIPGGAIKVSNKLFNVKTSGAYDEIDQISNTVVGSYMGKIIYLKNIASVFFEYEDDRYLARVNGENAIMLTVTQKSGRNIFDISEPIKEKLGSFKLKEGIKFKYISDQSASVEKRVSGFMTNLLQGIGLVGIIVFLILGIRSSSIVMMAIPLSIIIGLWIVCSFGFGLQQMSIAGLVVALGLLVDNSIAIIENIERFLADGFTRKEAAIKGTAQLVAPITSATLTTVLAFIPIIMMPDTTGAFIKSLPVTVIATLAASLLIAVTLTPFLASKLLKSGSSTTVAKQETAAFKGIKRFVEGPYRKALGWAMDHKWLTISLATLSLFGSFALFPLVGVSFFPKAEKPQFQVTVNLPNGSNLDATDNAVKYVEAVLAGKEEVKYYTANIGKGNPRIYYNTMPRNYAPNYAEIFVVLHEYDVDGFYDLLSELRSEFNQYPEARINVREFVQGPPSEGPIALKIYGDDLEKLQHYSGLAEKILLNNPGAINVDNPLSINNTDLYFDINRDKSMMLGVPIHVVDKTIRSYVNGSTIGTYRDKNADEFDMVMRYDFNDRFSMQDFDRISVKSMSGHFIPLTQLANIEFEETPAQISHEDMDRVATILADVDQGTTLDAVVAELRNDLDNLDWEEGYSYTFKGELESREESFGGLGTASLLALLLIMGVLIIQFKSFSQPLIIFSALPLAMIGSILMLYVNGVSFSFTAFIGLISLIGIAINNSIVLVDFANRLRAEGKTIVEAVKQAAEVRFIPIVLTTVTTILGLLPLTLSGGSMWEPMGWTIIGGLLTSTFFVLLLVPILYQLMTREANETMVSYTDAN